MFITISLIRFILMYQRLNYIMFFLKKRKKRSYLEYVYNASKMVNTECILDCANGIGGRIMESIANPHITLIHSDWKTPTKLNHLCSSDYVCTHKKTSL